MHVTRKKYSSDFSIPPALSHNVCNASFYSTVLTVYLQCTYLESTS